MTTLKVPTTTWLSIRMQRAIRDGNDVTNVNYYSPTAAVKDLVRQEAHTIRQRGAITGW